MMSSMKRSVARALCHPAVGRAVLRLFGDAVPCRGMRVGLGPRADPSVAARLFWGLYESAEIRLVERHLQPDLDVVELGGSIGVVSSAVARRLAPGRRLVVVEANPDLVSRIRANVGTNAAEAALEVVHGALAYDVEVGANVSLVVDRDNTRGRIGSSEGDGATVSVPAVRLSSVLARFEIGEYALVCDVEGAEWGLLEHDLPALDRCRQIILEVHARPSPPFDTSAELRERLRRLPGWTERERDGSVSLMERVA